MAKPRNPRNGFQHKHAHARTGAEFLSSSGLSGDTGGTGARYLAHVTPAKQQVVLLVVDTTDRQLDADVIRRILADRGICSINVSVVVGSIDVAHDNWSAIVETAVTDAIAGDPDAREWLSRLLLPSRYRPPVEARR